MQTNPGKLALKHIRIIAISVFILFFLISLTKIGTFTLDETLFHFPNLMNFYNNGLSAAFNAKYSTANTPLPYIIVAAVAKLSSPTLLAARLVTAVMSLFAFLIAMRLLNASGASRFCFFVVLFFPYFFMHSFTFYAVNYGLFFALLALLLLYNTQKNDSYGSYFAVGVCLSLAVLCQQFYLMIPVAILFPKFITAFRQNAEGRLVYLKDLFIKGLLLAIPMIVPLLLFKRWGGLTHPNFRFNSLDFGPTNLVGISFVTGFYCSPYVLQSLRRINKWELSVSAVLSVLAVLLFRPKFSDVDQGPGIFTGITYHIIIIAGKIHPIVTILMMMALTCFGLLVFIKLFKSLSSEFEYILAASCSFLILAYTFNTQIGERHLLPFIIILFLLVLPRIKKPYTVLFPAFVAMIGIGYFFYWTFVKFAST